MKKILLSTVLAISCVAANAFAIDAGSSWSEINSSATYRALFSDILFDGGVAKAVSDVCLEKDGVTLNGGTAVICAKYRLDNSANDPGSNVGRGQCETYETINLVKSINQTMLQCFSWFTLDHQDSSRNWANCRDLREVPVKIALDYSVDVYNRYPSGLAAKEKAYSGSPDFTKPFTIPACAN